MSTATRLHWENVYERNTPEAVSWYQPVPALSLFLIRSTHLPADVPIIDVGGGASTLVDELLDGGYTNLTVLDVSDRALNRAKARLGARAARVTWISADIRNAPLTPGSAMIWHDRAVYHFLTAEPDRGKYLSTMASTLGPGGFAIIATFGPNGPLKCSGLDTMRYSPEQLQKELDPVFQLVSNKLEIHTTPAGREQEFSYCLFRKL